MKKYKLSSNKYSKTLNLKSLIKKINNKKNALKLSCALISSIFICTPLTSCTKNNTNDTTQTVVSNVSNVDLMYNNIKTMFPLLDDEFINNVSLIMLLDEVKNENESGKLSSDIISKYKSIIDADNMMNDFYSFLNVIETKIIKDDTDIKLSSLTNNTNLSLIEDIVYKIKTLSKEDKKEEVLNEYNKLISLLNGEDLQIDNDVINIKKIDYSTRAIIDMYFRVALNYTKKYLNEEEINNALELSNDKNNKAYIKTELLILSNEMNNESKVDVSSIFNNKYAYVAELLKDKVNIDESSYKNIINYLNYKYLSSNASLKDSNSIMGEFDDDIISDMLLSSNAINSYNENNQKNIVPMSYLLVDEYKNTSSGKVDSIALDFVQCNSIKLINTVNENTTYNELINNPYYQNLHLYLTKQDFTHKAKNSNNEIVDTDIIHQQISDGVNLINYNMILSTFTKLPHQDKLQSEENILNENLQQVLNSFEEQLTGECINSLEFVK